MPRLKFIDNDQEHHRVLVDLGVLDDLENWPLFQAQEARFHALDDTIDPETWQRYFRVPGASVPPARIG